jgi:hypothetical protein
MIATVLGGRQRSAGHAHAGRNARTAVPDRRGSDTNRRAATQIETSSAQTDLAHEIRAELTSRLVRDAMSLLDQLPGSSSEPLDGVGGEAWRSGSCRVPRTSGAHGTEEIRPRSEVASRGRKVAKITEALNVER